MLDKLKKYKYISFDVFDTLLFRKVSSPQELFEYIQQKANKEGLLYENFPQMRLRGEQKAIKKNNLSSEISLDAIYQEIEFRSDSERELFENLEVQAELALCYPNVEIVSLLTKLREQGKVIIITSDMYLPTDVISQMLTKCGVCYNYLYVSSEYGIRKSSGKLFKRILNDLNISKGQFVHIGDNWKSDYLMPKLVGVSSIHYHKK